MEIIFWLFVLFTLLYEPVFGYFSYQKFKGKVIIDPSIRIKYYYFVMLGLWIPTLIILGLVAGTSLSLKDIGLRGLSFNDETLGSFATWFALGFAIIQCLSIVGYIIASKFSKKVKDKLIWEQQKAFRKSPFRDILPVSKKDKKVWTYVSLTAGVTEEIIYRGFLMFAISSLFPDLSIWVVMIIAAILFGLAHTYQGIGNVIRTTIFGLFFCVLYVGLGSIIPLIIFHFLVDYFGKIGTKEV